VRALLRGVAISVPGVVVAGAQSSGKSSVIESLCGINLPRGETITTRVPLVLRMNADPLLEAGYALISTHTDFKDAEKLALPGVGERIAQLTAELAGESGAVKDEPIHVKVTLPQGPTLTLINLPGITHISEEGSQVRAAACQLPVLASIFACTLRLSLASAPPRSRCAACGSSIRWTFTRRRLSWCASTSRRPT
jgi:hypothetical protein